MRYRPTFGAPGGIDGGAGTGSSGSRVAFGRSFAPDSPASTFMQNGKLQPASPYV
jgi:hypothetical protein